MRRRCYSGAEIVCNLSASPFRAGVTGTRREMIATRAARQPVHHRLRQPRRRQRRPRLRRRRLTSTRTAARCSTRRASARASPRPSSTSTAPPAAAARPAPGAATSRSSARAQRVVPALRDRRGDRGPRAPRLPCPAGRHDALPALAGAARRAPPRDELLDDFYEALALGVADYYRKIGAFKCIGLALSGGRDSLLTLLVAWRAVQLIHPRPRGRGAARAG